jgi:hypothetical protein
MIQSLLSYFIILGSIYMKIPQIKQLYDNKTAKGLAVSMFILDQIGYMINIAYNWHMDYPISSYGECFFLSFGNFVLLLLILKYTSYDINEKQSIDIKQYGLIITHLLLIIILFGKFLNTDILHFYKVQLLLYLLLDVFHK